MQPHGKCQNGSSKTNDELFEVKLLGEESLMEMKAARYGTAKLLDST